MRVLIVGAGQVGSTIGASLAENHDVVVVDIDSEKVNELHTAHDVLAIEGDGTSMSTLREAGISDADILIASTDDDETNLVICGSAKSLGDPFTIARVRVVHFLETWERCRGAFGVDFLVSTTYLTASDIIRVAGLPAAIDVDTFAGERVQMAEFEVTERSEMVGATVAKSDRFERVTFAALIQDGAVTIPTGDTVIDAGSRILVIGHPEGIRTFSDAVAPANAGAGLENIVIAGGSDIGYHTAALLEERGYQARLIERDTDRARKLAEDLPGTTLLQNDPTDSDFLLRERIDQSDIVVATTGSDETNLLVALLAQQIGVERTIAVVEDSEYTDLFEAVGIDVAINPRDVTAEEIVRFTQDGQIENLSLVEGRQAEVIEIEVDGDSILAGRAIKESSRDLPSGIVIGAITRERDFIIPGGTQ
jgi:trk system potassium uptake protein TrkA